MMYDIYGAEISGTVKNTVEEESNVSGLLRLFPKICVIGDSIASGTICYSNEDMSDTVDTVRYEWAWSSIWERKYGDISIINMARGGAAAPTWFNTFAKAWPDSEVCNAYVIALGTNDSLEEKGDEYSTDVTTFGGAYNHIVDMCLEKNPNAAIFLVTPYATPGSEGGAEVLRIIRQIGKLRDNCFYCNIGGKMTDPTDFKFKYWWNGHPNTLGNLVLANIIENKINDVIVKNWQFFAKFGALQEGTDTNPLVGY